MNLPSAWQQVQKSLGPRTPDKNRQDDSDGDSAGQPGQTLTLGTVKLGFFDCEETGASSKVWGGEGEIQTCRDEGRDREIEGKKVRHRGERWRGELKRGARGREEGEEKEGEGEEKGEKEGEEEGEGKGHQIDPSRKCLAHGHNPPLPPVPVVPSLHLQGSCNWGGDRMPLLRGLPG